MDETIRMLKHKYRSGILLIFATGFLGLAVMPQPDSITVYLVGDSTMSNKEVEAFPETGWGTLGRSA